VALRLTEDDALEVLAPHELGDLFAMVVRRNPVRVNPEAYGQHVADKNYSGR